MAFGITPQGFVRKRLEDIKLEIEDALRTRLGKNINLLPEELLGHIVGLFSERESSIWELLEAIYFSQYPDTAEGVNLDNVAAITGAIRKLPTKSVIEGQLLFGTPGTIIPQGSIVSVDGNSSARFVTLADVTLVAGTDEVQHVGFSADPTTGSFRLSYEGQVTTLLDWDDTAADVQTALEALSTIGADNVSVAGTIDQATGLSVTFLNDGADGLGKRNLASILEFANNTLEDSLSDPVDIEVTEATPGVPQGSVNMEAEETGSTDAPADTLSVIETPVGGWDSTVNPLDALLGQDPETDEEFRNRRNEQVAEAGAATPPAILADVLAINDVTAVVLFQNNTAVTDPEGRPPHSVDIVVQGGDEDEIAEVIFDTVGAGITFVGAISKIVTDSQGFMNTIKFSRPDEVDIWVEVDLNIDPELFPVDGTTQVRDAILAYGLQLTIGQDIVVFGSEPALSCAFGDVPGILDYAIRVGTAVSPTLDDNVEIEPREVPVFDSSRITVVTL